MQKSVFLVASSARKYVNKTQQKMQSKGQPLSGIKHDIQAFKSIFKHDDHYYIQSSQNQEMLLSKTYIKQQLRKFLNKKYYQHFLFYTGHGHTNGDWKIDTTQQPQGDRLTLQQLIQIWKNSKISNQCRLIIIMDSCHSGAWCYRLGDKNQPNISIFASSNYGEQSKDHNGGLLLNCLFGKQSLLVNNFQFLKYFQNPVYLHRSSFVAKLQVDQVKLLQKDIGNALMIKPSIGSYTQILKTQSLQIPIDQIMPELKLQKTKIYSHKEQQSKNISNRPSKLYTEPEQADEQSKNPQNQTKKLIANLVKTNKKEHIPDKKYLQQKGLAQNWVDSSCYFYENMSFSGSVITAKKRCHIFGKKVLLDESQYKIVFNKIVYLVGLGIIDVRYRDKQILKNLPNKICYWSNCVIFDGKNSKEKGPGFKPGKPISVRLNRNVGSITWEIDGKEYKHQSVQLLNKEIRWVPYIVLDNEKDSVKICQ